jgi:GH35 family endo-1,4-beta-xylanase
VALELLEPESYPGREAGAGWRREAEERIEKLRTAEFRLNAVDGSGKALPGARIRIRQTKSAFAWGTAASAKFLFKDGAGEDLKHYEEALAGHFNILTEENSLKWRALAGDYGEDYSLALGLKNADWAAAHGMDFRAHCLLWPSWKNSPKFAEGLKGKPAELRAAVLKHVHEAARALKGKAVEWDVVNEPFDNREIMDALGSDQILADCFKAAHEEDPQARLFINDYGIFEGGGGQSLHRKRLEDVVKGLLAAKAPLQGIGLQGHFSPPLSAPEDALKVLDHFAAYGLPLRITEYDTEHLGDALAADYLRDMLILTYSHPAVDGFIMWGFWDAKHWHKDAPLFRADWSAKPALKVWEELVEGKWRSKAEALSGADGRASLRGHLGDYEIEAEYNGKKALVKTKLKSGGTELEIKMK